jgi:hypothetical protein
MKNIQMYIFIYSRFGVDIVEADMPKVLKTVLGAKKLCAFTIINFGNQKESQFLKYKIRKNQFIKTKKQR